MNPRQVRGACALDCPDTCSWIVTTNNGAAVSLRGDRDHPYTRGALCNKVVDYLDYARSPERLVHPMRRVGAKGSGDLVRISWDEALDVDGDVRQLRHGSYWSLRSLTSSVTDVSLFAVTPMSSSAGAVSVATTSTTIWQRPGAFRSTVRSRLVQC